MALRTIGVALAIPEPYGNELQTWRQRFGDPMATAIPTHITLLPPTEVGDGELGPIEEHLQSIAVEERAFEIHLRGTGTFRPVSPVVFVQLAGGISDCERLEARIRSGPLAREIRFNYHPHVTIAHDLPDDLLDTAFAKLSAYEAVFPIWGFSLYEHGSDGVWRPQRDFPFGRVLPGPHPGHPQPTP
jgi:2'-5' RNA ligase